MNLKIISTGIILLLLIVSLITVASATETNPENGIGDKRERQDTTPSWVDWDVDGDEDVDLDDLDFLVDSLFVSGNPIPAPELRADFNNNGEVNIGDVALLVDELIKRGIIVVDEDAPVITLLNPDDGNTYKTSNPERDIHFKFKVTDESEIERCELIINNDVEHTFYNPQRDVVLDVKIELDRDNYEWKVKCIDTYGNEAESRGWNFEIKKRSTSSNNNAYPNYNTYTPSDTITHLGEVGVATSIDLTGNQKLKLDSWALTSLVLGLLILILLLIVLIVRTRR